MDRRSVLPLRSRSTIFIAAATAWFALAGASQPSPDSIRTFYGRIFRVQTIAWRILASNIQSCPARKGDFGLASVSPNPDASAATQSTWASALGIGEGSTVLAVFPGGPAQAAGLKVGDHIVAVDNVHWQAAGDGRRAFAQAMAAGQQHQLLNLSVNRGAENLAIAIPARQICAGEAILTTNANVNASATGTTIVVEGGLEQLLSDDDELAAVIAHEAAHIFLGHSEGDRDADRRNRAVRSTMERDADVMSVRLMLRAGFNPDAAINAQARTAHAARGPIARLLGLYGPYMTAQERGEFLRTQIIQARAEMSNPGAMPPQ